MAIKHMKKHSTSLVSRQMQIKHTYHYTPVRKTQLKTKPPKTDNVKYWQGCGATGTFVCCWWECIFVQPLWETDWHFLMPKHTLTIRPSNLFLVLTYEK